MNFRIIEYKKYTKDEVNKRKNYWILRAKFAELMRNKIDENGKYTIT